METYHLHLDRLSVGYNKKPLIKDIEIGIRNGEIISMIGPNGAGKSTIIKTIIRQLSSISGRVAYAGKDMESYSFREMSSKMAVVLTERIRPELMTCHDIVATGRYPYTGRLGILSEEDEQKVEDALRIVHTLELGERDFNAISDGQRQRVLLARAIAQEPEIIILDEPTSFLDVRHKLDLLSILRAMAKEKGITVLMSLHEIDLAMKISDRVICVKGDKIAKFGVPEEVFGEKEIRELYEIDNGYFDPVFGSIELPAPEGEVKAMVISACGNGIPVFRKLQKEGKPFVAGILFENDMDYQLARLLAREVISEKPFCRISEENLARAREWIGKVEEIYVTDIPIGETNQALTELIELAEKSGLCHSHRL